MRRREFPMMMLAAATSARSADAPGDGGSAPRVAPHPGATGARTEAETRAGIQPAETDYPEADIRRYGARIDAADNTAAINAALLVSAHGGSPAFVPGGSWRMTSPLQAMGSACMHGVGNASILVAESCDGIVFGTSGNYAVTGLSRFFRDFQIVGADDTRSSYCGIVVNFAAKSTQRVNGTRFENIHVANFAVGASLRGLWFSGFAACHFYNCYRGIAFIGENCVNSIVDCTFNRAGIRGSGGAWGVSFQSVDGESTQSTRIISGQIYFYDILVNVLLAFELQIEHCDLSAAQEVGVQISGTIGGCWVRDCWIETANDRPTVGIKVANITPSVHTCVHIVANHINCDTAAPGSQGIVVGNANAGIIVNENAVVGFDRAVTLGASPHLVCKFNRLDCITSAYGSSSHAVLLDSLSTDNEIGPNEVIRGASQEALMRKGDPLIRVADSSSLPAGTPVEFDADANGFARGATYFVLTSASNAITVGISRRGAAIPAADGGSANVFAAPSPLTFTRGTPRGLSFHGRGALVLSFSGFASPLCAVLPWSVSGRLIALSVDGARSIAGPSNSEAMTAGEIPEFLRPDSPRAVSVLIQDSGTASLGVARLTTAGVLEFFRTANFEGFARSGMKGICGQTIVYTYG